jgi:phage terminase large subunit GpA-like protein
MYQKGRPWAYDQLESLLTREFIREDGTRLSVCCGGFDTGYAACQRALYQYLRPRYGRRYFALKGASQKWAPIWAQGRRDERIRLFIIGTNRTKALIYRRATISVPGPGYMHIPVSDDYGPEWFKQLLAEDSHTERDRGVEMQIFEMPATTHRRFQLPQRSPRHPSRSHRRPLHPRSRELGSRREKEPGDHSGWRERERSTSIN